MSKVLAGRLPDHVYEKVEERLRQLNLTPTGYIRYLIDLDLGLDDDKEYRDLLITVSEVSKRTAQNVENIIHKYRKDPIFGLFTLFGNRRHIEYKRDGSRVYIRYYDKAKYRHLQETRRQHKKSYTTEQLRIMATTVYETIVHETDDLIDVLKRLFSSGAREDASETKPVSEHEIKQGVDAFTKLVEDGVNK